MMKKRTTPDTKKINTGCTFDPVILARLDRFCGGYSRSAVVECIVASYLDMADEEGIRDINVLLTKPSN